MGKLNKSRQIETTSGGRLKLANGESRRQSPVFDLQSDDIIHSEKGPMEAVLTVGTDTVTGRRS
ncbi:unnamed protein product [Albugo candida]|uniref:Uncharacterized protein n=1 Tax=Albugo candida TaxID=65357 RepID=A0A024G5A4_9STRA|nr:unnamed protein product [Albugo candida]|eukprot:CCI41484.1 unnamed protein product [Albugo candida]